MGRRRSWFSAVKKALGSEHGNQRSRKSKKKWFAKHQEADPSCASAENEPVAYASLTVEERTWTADKAVVDAPWSWSILEEPYTPVTEELKLTRVGSKDKALGTPMAPEDEALSAKAAAEVVWLTNLARFAGKSKEEVAAIKIQTAFRRHMAKRTLKALRGLVRLKSLMQGSSIKRQTTSTLQCMQILSHVQSQIRARRIRISEENLALQWQLQQKHEKQMEKMKLTIGDDWNDSTKSMEKLEASLRNRQAAAMRRERALAYAHSHQQKWRNASKTPNPIFMDPINPHWG